MGPGVGIEACLNPPLSGTGGERTVPPAFQVPVSLLFSYRADATLSMCMRRYTRRRALPLCPFVPFKFHIMCIHYLIKMSFSETDPRALYFWTLGVHTVGAVWLFYFYFFIKPSRTTGGSPTPGDS